MIDLLYRTINDIIRPIYKNTSPGGSVILRDSTCKDVRLNKTGKLLNLQFDRGSSATVFTLFNCTIPDVCKVADRILIYPTSSKIFVFICELKTSNTTGAIEQVRSSYNLAEYIIKTGLRLIHNPNLSVEYRGIIFSSNAFEKGTTKPKNLVYTPDGNTGLKYKHLKSGGIYDLDAYTY